MDSPRPLPSVDSFSRRRKRSKMRARSSGGMPGPSSFTSRNETGVETGVRDEFRKTEPPPRNSSLTPVSTLVSFLEVNDDGPGIPPAERARIFDRFRRLENESTEGSGLGLSIVKEIAQRHGAVIEVTEGDGGRGTRVAVIFGGAPATS